MASCVFCAVVDGSAPSHVVHDDESVTAFLDIRPLFVGHVLVAPKTHVVTLPELPAADVGPFFESVQRVTVAVQTSMGAQGTFVAMNNSVSQSVPHLHVHVVPRTKGDGLRGFFWPRTDYRDEAHMAETAAAIAAAI